MKLCLFAWLVMLTWFAAQVRSIYFFIHFFELLFRIFPSMFFNSVSEQVLHMWSRQGILRRTSSAWIRNSQRKGTQLCKLHVLPYVFNQQRRNWIHWTRNLRLEFVSSQELWFLPVRRLFQKTVRRRIEELEPIFSFFSQFSKIVITNWNKLSCRSFQIAFFISHLDNVDMISTGIVVLCAST